MDSIAWPTDYVFKDKPASEPKSEPIRLIKKHVASPTGMTIPQYDWSCLWVTDLKDEAGEDEYMGGACEYCGYSKLRFVHTLVHLDSDLRLAAGCCCAALLCKEYDAEEAERKLRNRFARKERWLTRKWRISQKGNPYLNIGNYNVGVHRDSCGAWGYRVNGEFNKKKYNSEEEAKLALFDNLVKRLHW